MSTNSYWADKKLTRQQRADLAFRYLDWLLTKNVPSGGFRLLYAITQCLNEVNQFHCFPSTDHLAEQIGRKQSTVWEMLPKLEKIGAIEVEWGSKGSGHPNVYRLPEEFLAFYFGPEKGRRSAPKKYRQAGISKYRQAGISDAPEIPVEPSENTGSTPKKYRQTGMSHFLATSSHKKERGSAARTSRVVRESASNSTADDAAIPEPLIPVPRAAGAARIQPLAKQERPPPSRDDPDMGCPAANGADAAPTFAEITAGFDRLKREYPPDRLGDDGDAFRAFCDAERECGPSRVIEAITELSREHGDDVPDLAEALMIIERNQ